MKTADIEIGAEYAHGTPWDIDHGLADRVKVLAVKVERRAHPGPRGFRGNLLNDGVEVQFVGDRRDGQTIVTTPAKINGPWAAYDEERLRTQEAIAENKRKAADREQHLRTEIEDHLGSQMTDDHRQYLKYMPTDRLEIVASLVTAAYNFGTSAP